MTASGGPHDDTLARGSILGRYEIGRLVAAPPTALEKPAAKSGVPVID